MREIVVILALIVLTGSGLAAEPPSRFDFPPKMPVKIVRAVHVPTICKNPMQKIGCAYTIRGTCWIVIATKLPNGWLPGVIRHERAHCNGWPADHPR